MDWEQSSISQFECIGGTSSHDLIDDLVDEINHYRNESGGQSPLFQEEKPPAPEQHCVYTIICETATEDEIIERANNEFGWVADFLRKAAKYYTEYYYVGKTQRPYRRMNQHTQQSYEGAKFTRVFKPIALRDARFYESEAKASQMELDIAKQLRQSEGVFVPHVSYR